MKLRRAMKAQSPKKKEKERNNKEKRRESQSEDMQQGSSQRICNKKNQHQSPMYVQISRKKNPANKIGIIFVTHGPSSWDPEWMVKEKWFGR